MKALAREKVAKLAANRISVWGNKRKADKNAR